MCSLFVLYIIVPKSLFAFLSRRGLSTRNDSCAKAAPAKTSEKGFGDKNVFCVKCKMVHENEVIWTENASDHNLDPKLFLLSPFCPCIEVTLPRELESEGERERAWDRCFSCQRLSGDGNYY